MKGYLDRNRYYCDKRLRDLFSKWKIPEEELIGKEFSKIYGVINKYYRKLALKCHPDKAKSEKEKQILGEKFKELTEEKKRLEQHVQALKEGKDPSTYARQSEAEKRRMQREINKLLLYRNKLIKRTVFLFICTYIFLNPEDKVLFSLSKLAAGSAAQSAAYQLYMFSINIWPWLFLALIVNAIFFTREQMHSQELHSDIVLKKLNTLYAIDNTIICVSAMVALSSVVVELIKNNHWPDFGTVSIQGYGLRSNSQ
ncbi:DnaJ domain-containing protein [Wolbachia endosymbiont of Ctenocephalides felis wCfeT]|uniref:DnaJ domain-containing protein n=1 Tax=Wolbachia endosymbiont of Ctenocephalides felis wCfeT TaxID=2732593 RepID=UPI00350EE3A4